MNTVLNQPCPEIPFFGARYPDARCIDGYLWDLDSDEDGKLTQGGDIPCPFCNTEKFIEYDPVGTINSFLFKICGDENPDVEQQRQATKMARDWYLGWINKMKERYGVVSSR